MSVGEYLKQAAAQLRRAATASRQEADDARRNITLLEQEVSRQVSSLENNRNDARREAAENHIPVGRIADAGVAREIDQQIKKIQTDMEQQKQQLNQQIQNKLNLERDLNSRASDLERQASAGI